MGLAKSRVQGACGVPLDLLVATTATFQLQLAHPQLQPSLQTGQVILVG